MLVGEISFGSNICYMGSCFVVTSSCLCFLGGLGVYGVWRVRVTLC